MVESNEPQHPCCPSCQEPAPRENEFFPFCSKRCRLVDLGKWMDGEHRISRPIEEADFGEEE